MSDLLHTPPMAMPVECPPVPASPSQTLPAESAADNPAPKEPEVAPEPKPKEKAKSRKVLKAEKLFRIKFRFEELAYSNLLAEGTNRTERDSEKKQELKESVSRVGILEPLIVYPDAERGKHVIIAGEGRYEVAGELGMTTLPCMVADQKPSEAARLWLARDENVCREEFRPMDRARMYKRLRDALKAEGIKLTQEEFAELVGGVSQSQVSTYLGLTELDEEVQRQIESGKLSVKAATRGRQPNGDTSQESTSEPEEGEELRDSECPEREEYRHNDPDTKIQFRVHFRKKKLNLDNLVRSVRRWLSWLETKSKAVTKQ